jgi:hypothetical protein
MPAGRHALPLIVAEGDTPDGGDAFFVVDVAQ